MTERDYEECKYINEVMRFYTFADFIKFRNQIKNEFKKLRDPMFYKWYVYANINCSMHQKDSIWRFLNGEKEDNFTFKISSKGEKNEFR